MKSFTVDVWVLIMKKGAIDDCDINVTFPYYGSQISAPPTSMSRAGRFNRSSYSYLYMATSKETCISELKLDVGQFCSIAEFKPVNKGRFLTYLQIMVLFIF